MDIDIIKELNYRQSFNRFCDDYVIELLKYLPLEDKIRLLCVSKQFVRCLPMRQYSLMSWIGYSNYRNNLNQLSRYRFFNFNAFKTILSKFKYIRRFSFTHLDNNNKEKILAIIKKMNIKVEYFKNYFEDFEEYEESEFVYLKIL
jgi:hypothetical protein